MSDTTLDAAVDASVDAGGRLAERGEHPGGVKYALIEDPDGYVVELLGADARVSA